MLMSIRKAIGFCCRCLAGIAAFFIFTAMAGTLTGKPTFFSIVQSNSMYPILSRGDIVLVRPVNPSDVLSVGDIILFKATRNSSSKSWIIHQIADGNDLDGYITKGEANFQTDQANNNLPLIKRDLIASKAIAYKGSILKVPLLGFPLLWLNNAKDWILILPLICLTIIFILMIDILICKSKVIPFYNRNLLVFSGGFLLSLLLACYTVTSSQLWLIDYNAADTLPLEKTLSSVYNKWPFPLLLACNSSDQNLELVIPNHILSPKQSLYPHLMISEPHDDTSPATLWIAAFLPLLPATFVVSLTKISFGLALVIVSVIPGLPLMLFPLFLRLFSKSR